MADAPFLAYGRQVIEDDDLAAVAQALRADFLTTGPRVAQFEAAFAEKVGARHAIACSNGTAALHLAMLGLGVGPGDVVIAPTLTFAATANCARYQGAEVVFADVDPDTGLMTADTLAEAMTRIGGRPLKAVLPVHLNGHAADLPALKRVAEAAGAPLVEDAAHAVGTAMTFDNVPERVGDCRHSALTCFSFHPVKTLTTGEGGMVTTNDDALAQRVARLRSHGIVREPADFVDPEIGFDGEAPNPWAYEQQALGYNYRLPDVLCALGLSQLAKLDRFVERRRQLAQRYNELLPALAPLVRPVAQPWTSRSALHLFVVLIDFTAAGQTRRQVMEALRAKGIGTQVHYIPVHRQPYYRALYGEQTLSGAEAYYARCLSLPLQAGMADGDVDRVVGALGEVLGG
ncbi:UDP-4-amino-4,6-dideoxy-N-acetyl-beta-L-altrosamine transaminase [Phenylobacterium montanum]|uniref:UDP-4-amino-4, 6-dideoxy-N-acetyl-beta-L-altrosamine transaminase n=1 Tax=Phenylobacterium montanum TaxID=2823693 RepID=A0A975ITE3_9CAUL|nr:UDP-4-amino-4,6-dideoxy-N-acetyl-beta-L-altrosamine transaminase [Caulobacter sp. S6]QUD86777.1 UDP-4-amino-4,6-dideoxy-N-acetyl-beta-L-altrosamine transaminase [Caulobacter sp. S6]